MSIGNEHTDASVCRRYGGDGMKNGLATSLYFTAAPNDENDVLFGNLTANRNELLMKDQAHSPHEYVAI